jgi:uncharacterized GH25 family protein
LKIPQAVILFFAFAGAASAHDAWLEPGRFRTATAARVPVTFYVGHSGEQEKATLAPRPRWLLSMKAHGPRGTADLLNGRRFNPAAGFALAPPGTHMLSLNTSDFRNEMTAKEFGEYMEEEGLAGAKVAWERRPITSRKVRESYRRHAKALVHSGRGGPLASGPATRRIGQRLELVPAVNPYALRAGQPLPLTVWHRGRPLAGALVTLGTLDRPTDPLVKVRSGANGRVSFPMPQSGRWMVNVVWSVPATTSNTDFETSFSSLTFGR